ncbi:hypothetical protein OQA88_10278 [Cercophora sp. LCS_1]
MGFKFLIHSDFDTQANRQGIVTSSARNKGLAVGIADAFVKAVLQLCEHPTLKFQWMRYLPQQDAYPWDSFWEGVIDRIKDRLALHLALVPASQGPLRKICDCLNLKADGLDRDGQPLLPDLHPERYLSTEYDRSDLIRLKDYGLQYMSIQGHIARAKADLASGDGRIKSRLGQDWQTRVAKLLRMPFSKGWESRIREVKELQPIPLRTGEWTSTTLGPVYYADLEDTDLAIPSALTLRVVDPAATANTSRRRLFDDVGVQHASIRDVQSAVVKRVGKRLQLSESVECLRFLFLTQSFGSPDIGTLPIYDHRQKRKNGCGAPGFNVLFVNDAYLEDCPALSDSTEGEITSWVDWLTEICDLTTLVEVYDVERAELTPAGKDPGLVPGTGNNSPSTRNNIPPFPDLVAVCNRFMVDGEFFPGLKLETSLDNVAAGVDWDSLSSAFELGHDRPMLDFGTSVLRYIVMANSRSLEPLAEPDRMLQPYTYLQSKIDEYDNPDEHRQKIITWSPHGSAFWSSPVELFSKYVLRTRYVEAFSPAPDKLLPLKAFFVHTLGIRVACDWHGNVEDLKNHQQNEEMDHTRATALCRCLSEMRLDGDDARDLKAAFLEEWLIFSVDEEGDTAWHQSSDCLWSSATAISGKVVLDNLYADLQGFFVNVLGVPRMTAEMAKETIMVFNSFLATSPGVFDQGPVLANRIFPVRFPGGEVSLCNEADAFSLLDRKPLGETFAHVANFLDFDLQELRRLQPFIRWTGLQDRYFYVISPQRSQGKGVRVATNRSVYRVERDSMLVHVREADGLAIYVPRSEGSQEVCFNSKLPRTLCEWLMTDPTTQIAEAIPPQAINAVQSVLNAKPFAVGDTLDQHGIGEINILNVDADAVQEDALTQTRPTSPAGSLRPVQSTPEADSSDNERDSMEETYRIRSTSQIERDKKIGAAGELQMQAFQLLSNLNPPLPSFSLSNWQSTIRHCVTRHPGFSDLQPWTGTETSDIVYDDTSGELTRLLIEKGYLPRGLGKCKAAVLSRGQVDDKGLQYKVLYE